jgi:hypothetical protein
MDYIIHICSALKHPADYHGRNIPCFITKRPVIHFHCAMRTQLQYSRKKCRRLRPTVFPQSWHEHALLLEHNVALFVVLVPRREHRLLLEHNVTFFVVLESRHERALLLEHHGTCAWRAAAQHSQRVALLTTAIATLHVLVNMKTGFPSNSNQTTNTTKRTHNSKYQNTLNAQLHT